MKRFCVSLLIFIFIFFVSIHLFEYTVPFYWGNEGLRPKFEYLDAHKSDINTIFIGSSRTFRHVDPVLFDMKMEGKTNSYNLGMNAMFNPESYYIYDNLIKQDGFKFDYIFIEFQWISLLADKNVHTVRSKYHLSWSTFSMVMDHYWNMYKQSHEKESAKSTEKNYSSALNYMKAFIERQLLVGLFKHIFGYHFSEQSDEYNRSYYLGPDDKGFVSFEYQQMQGTDYSKKLKDHEENLKIAKARKKNSKKVYKKGANKNPEEVQFNKIMSIIEQAKNKGTKVIFISPPRKQSDSYLSLFLAIPEDNRIDMNDPFLYPEFYDEEYLFDKGHLNEIGAKLYTKELAKSFIALERGDDGL